MGDTTRTVMVWESQFDLNKLKASNYNFQIAKSVVSASGKVISNVIWKSTALAPTYNISWDVVYALNWTAKLPADGATVVAGSVWQPCAKGEVYDIGEDGFFAPSTATPEPGFMSIGSNNYTIEGNDLHVIIGVQNTSGGYDIIYTEPSVLFTHGSGKWQPTEKITWWYDTGMRTSSMFSSIKVATGGGDFTNPQPLTNKYFIATTFLTTPGTWVNSPNPPFKSLYAPLASKSTSISNGTGKKHGKDETVVVELFPAIRLVQFTYGFAPASQGQITAFVQARLRITWPNTVVIFETPVRLSVTVGEPPNPPENSIEAIGVKAADLDQAITSALNDPASGVPRDNKWKFVPTIAGSDDDVLY